MLSRANLWVNGVKVADQSQLQGAYSRLEYDVTAAVHAGVDAVALDVFPNDSSDDGYGTLSMVDWNPRSPDGWTGLQFAPQLAQDGSVSLRDVHVVEDNAADLSSSDLTVVAELRNNGDVAQRVELSGAITHAGTAIALNATVRVAAGHSRRVELTPAEVPALHVEHPAVWWPSQMGAQPLYHLRLVASVDGARSDAAAEDFGIRTVTSWLTPVQPGTFGRHGYRQFAINGQPFVVRGSGWSQDIFLRYSPATPATSCSPCAAWA